MSPASQRSTSVARLAGLAAAALLAAQAARGDAQSPAVGAADRVPVPLARWPDEQAAIRIDGRLDEPAWQTPRLNEPLRMLRPDTLEIPPWATDFRVFYTEKGLYLSLDMEQPSETLVERLTARDVLSVNRDYISITIDVSGAGRYGYWVNLALGDNQIDGTILPERQFSDEWDGAWTGATQLTERGWAAELFMPWSQMAMPKATDRRTIGIYTSRRVAQLNQVWGWPALPRSGPRFMSAFQPLELVDIDPRPQWSVFPYLSTTYDGYDGRSDTRTGLDVFWRLSSNLQLTATANPDFGSVEADDVIVNLTADEVFFPEKRLFFQEGQDIYATSPRADPDSDRPLIVVNTRRIGGRPAIPPLPAGDTLPLRERLRPVDLLGALNATGQAGSFRYGLLAAFEDDTRLTLPSGGLDVAGRDFGVARLLYEDRKGAAYRGLGLIATHVERPDRGATVVGADIHRLSRSGRWNLDGQLLYSDVEAAGEGFGGFVDVTLTPRQGLSHSLSLTWLDDAIDINDFGFQTRNDYREMRYAVEWIESGFTRIRDVAVMPALRYQENGAGFATDIRLGADAEISLNNLDRIKLAAAWQPPQYDDRNSFGNGTFAVEPRVIASIEYLTDTAERLSLLGRVGYRGEMAGGHTLETKAGVTWRPANNLNVELALTRLDRDGWLLHQQERDFTAFRATQWQPLMLFEWFPNARQQFRLAMQWAVVRAIEQDFYRIETGGTSLVPLAKPPGPANDFGLSQLTFQLRYRWQIAPLSDLFVVYTRGDTRRAAPDDYDALFRDSWRDPLSDLFVVKLRYRFGS